MNELEAAHKIKHRLNHGTDHLDTSIAARLHAAREQALARHGAISSNLSLVGVGHLSHVLWLPRMRSAVAVVALALGIVGWNYWSDHQRAGEMEVIDTALLSDELPISAYLDRGFDAWLERTSQER